MDIKVPQRGETVNRGDAAIHNDGKFCKSREDEVFLIGLITLAVCVAVCVLYDLWLRHFLPKVPCFFSNVLGFYCPGCGGTRAIYALMRGEFLKAVWYHPLVPYGAVISGGFLLTQGLHRFGIKCIKPWKYHDWYLYGAIIVLVCNFLIKNLLRLVWGIMI